MYTDMPMLRPAGLRWRFRRRIWGLAAFGLAASASSSVLCSQTDHVALAANAAMQMPALPLPAATSTTAEPSASPSRAAPTQAAAVTGGSVPPAVAREYARPQTQIDIGQRRINLFCMGQGKATVLFDAGGSDWSVVWALVQPVVAKRARACSYDRAGLGYSDSDPGARTPFAIADDLHKLVHAGGISQPLILVGHSLGGFNVKLYAALFPEDVAGLVLVDPSEERTNDRMRAFLTRAWGPAVAAQDELAGHRWLAGAIDRLRACADAAERTPLDPSTPFYRRYTDPVRPALGPIIAAERTVRQVTAQYQRAQASELAFSVYGDALSDDMYSELFKPGMFGTRPLIVLAHKEDAGSDPVDIADAAGTIKLHRETALLSTLGCQETVADSGHYIELDQPQVVIAAIERVLDQVERPGLAGSVLRGHGGPSERKADLPDSKSVARSSRLAGMCEE